MNASAYLQAQGWRGSGFSLDRSNRGLSKPLLVSQKTDQTGLGTKRHDFKDQWWTSAFDKSLKSLGTGASTPTTTEHIHTSTPIKHTNPTVAKHAGLYNRFRKSETLEATFAPPTEPPTEADSADMSRTKKSEPGSAQRKGAEAQRAAAKQQASTLPQVEERDTTGPILGVLPDEASAAGAATNGNPTNEGKGKKRKRTHDSAEPSGKKSKKQKTVPVEDTNGGVALPQASSGAQDSTTSGPANETLSVRVAIKERNRAEKKARKAAKRKVQAQEQDESADVPPGTATKAKGAKQPATKKAKLGGKHNSSFPDPDDRRNALVGEPHEESIMALRNKGERVDLPGDPGDPDNLRAWLVHLYEKEDEKRVRTMLDKHFPRPTEEHDPTAKKRKQPKYDSEKKKREAKRDARRWVEVRKLTHLYRPDGRYIDSIQRGISAEDAKSPKKAAKQDYIESTERGISAENTKPSKKGTKEGKRQALKQKASAKESKKLEKQDKQAKKRAATKENKAEKKRANHDMMMTRISAKHRSLEDEEQAKAAGRSYDEIVAQKAGQLRVSIEEYKKESTKRLLEKATAGGGDVSVLGIRNGADDDGDADADANVADPDSDAGSNLDSDPDSDSGSDYSEVRSSPNSVALVDHAKQPPATEDFIPLAPGDPSESTSASQMGFVIDTTGSASLAPPSAQKPVKDMTRAERNARLQAMRQRRAERAAATGVVRMSKKERKAQKGAKKEERLNRMVNDILVRDGAKGKEGQKSTTKTARREARKVLRAVKKGTMREEEVLPQWRGLLKGVGKKGMMIKGNGGKESRKSVS